MTFLSRFGFLILPAALCAGAVACGDDAGDLKEGKQEEKGPNGDGDNGDGDAQGDGDAGDGDNGEGNNGDGYVCPSLPSEYVAFEPSSASDQRLRVGFNLPEGAERQEFQDLSEIVTVVAYGLPFERSRSNDNYPQRLFYVEVEQQGPYTKDYPYFPPTVEYAPGTGYAVDGEESPERNAYAGEIELGGESLLISRAIGPDQAHYTVPLRDGDEFYLLSVRVKINKTQPVFVADLDGSRACLADFDRVGLEVAKSFTLLDR